MDKCINIAHERAKRVSVHVNARIQSSLNVLSDKLIGSLCYYTIDLFTWACEKFRKINDAWIVVEFSQRHWYDHV